MRPDVSRMEGADPIITPGVLPVLAVMIGLIWAPALVVRACNSGADRSVKIETELKERYQYYRLIAGDRFKIESISENDSKPNDVIIRIRETIGAGRRTWSDVVVYQIVRRLPGGPTLTRRLPAADILSLIESPGSEQK